MGSREPQALLCPLTPRASDGMEPQPWLLSGALLPHLQYGYMGTMCSFAKDLGKLLLIEDVGMLEGGIQGRMNSLLACEACPGAWRMHMETAGLGPWASLSICKLAVGCWGCHQSPCVPQAWAAAGCPVPIMPWPLRLAWLPLSTSLACGRARNSRGDFCWFPSA